MNTKTKVMQRIPWWTVVLVLAAMAVPVTPVAASEVTDSIRAQGRSAMDAMRADIRPELPGVEIADDGRAAVPPLTAEESIRVNGYKAMRVMARDLGTGFGVAAVAPPEMIDHDGLVSVSATVPVASQSGAESL